MFRQLALAALIATGTVAGTAATASAQPVEFDRHDHDRDHHHARYEVLVRHHGHWDVHGTYNDREEAERAAWHLERHGHEVRIERVRGW